MRLHAAAASTRGCRSLPLSPRSNSTTYVWISVHTSASVEVDSMIGRYMQQIFLMAQYRDLGGQFGVEYSEFQSVGHVGVISRSSLHYMSNISRLQPKNESRKQNHKTGVHISARRSSTDPNFNLK